MESVLSLKSQGKSASKRSNGAVNYQLQLRSLIKAAAWKKKKVSAVGGRPWNQQTKDQKSNKN